jgi:hypothetical protein
MRLSRTESMGNNLKEGRSSVIIRGRVECPCCFYPTLTRRAVYETCTLCGWTDDGQDDPRAAEIWDGPNRGLSLVESRQNFRRHLSYLPTSEEDAGSLELYEARRSLMAAYDWLQGAAGSDESADAWEQVVNREGAARGLAAERAAEQTRSPQPPAPPGAVLIAPALPLLGLILSAAACLGSVATSGEGSLWWYPLLLFLVITPPAGLGTLALVISLRARGAMSLRHPAAVAGVVLACLDLLVPAGLLWLGYKVLSELKAGSIIF